MPKLKLFIDPDIDFSVVVAGEAFGFQAAIGFRLKKVNEGTTGLSDKTIVEISSTEYSESDSE